jgi:hypothetical protein
LPFLAGSVSSLVGNIFLGLAAISFLYLPLMTLVRLRTRHVQATTWSGRMLLIWDTVALDEIIRAACLIFMILILVVPFTPFVVGRTALGLSLFYFPIALAVRLTRTG